MFRLPVLLLAAVAVAVAALVACSDGNDSAAADVPPGPPPPPTQYELDQRDYIEASVVDKRGGTYGALAHLAAGLAPLEGSFDETLREMNEREDTADFNLPGLLTVLYRYVDSPLLDESLYRQIEQELIRFKFWPDELEPVPGTTDNLTMVTWTENHYILFAAGAYLAGQLYPDSLFAASGRTGREQMEIFRPRVMKWLEMRYQTGFSEWLSNVYYNEDIPALLALIDLADDAEVVEKSKIVLDLMFADIALNSFQGYFTSTHGRTYHHKTNARHDSTRGATHLAFGLHTRRTGNLSATMMAVSEKYRVPEVLYRIANDSEAVMENRQRMGIKLEEAARWGLDLGRLEDGMTLLTMEPYAHPLFIDLFYDMLNAYDWWDQRDFKPFKDYRSVLDDPDVRKSIAASFEWDITRNMRPEVNIYTYRTPYYMLSTAQDWRKGFGGDQSSIWQATLSKEAVAFTTHPAKESEGGGTPDYWVGYGTLPRAAQVKNVVVTLYDVETREGLYYPTQPMYSHAFLPRAMFDETLKDGQWFFAREGDAYLALWSSDPEADWQENTTREHGAEPYEIIARGEKTAWILELGDAAAYGDFASFQGAITAASLDVDAGALTVSYQSPSQGVIEMGWEGPVLNNGVSVQLQAYPRYENPWSQAGFPGSAINFAHGDSYLKLDFDSATRDASGFRD